jgi:hypothetical protein
MYRARKFLSAQGLSFNDGGTTNHGCSASTLYVMRVAGGLDVLASLKKSRRAATQKLALGSNIFKSIRAVQSISESGQKNSESVDKTIKPGCYVKISGLKNRPELNDVIGVVLQVEEGSVVVATQVVAAMAAHGYHWV